MAEDDAGKVIGRGGRTDRRAAHGGQGGVGQARTGACWSTSSTPTELPPGRTQAAPRDRRTRRAAHTGSTAASRRCEPQHPLERGHRRDASAATERRVERRAGTDAASAGAAQGIGDREAAAALRRRALCVAERGLAAGGRRVAGVPISWAAGSPGVGHGVRVSPGPRATCSSSRTARWSRWWPTRCASVDTDGRRIEVDRDFLGRERSVKIDVFTLFPDWFDWFTEQRHVRNALALGHRSRRRPAGDHAAAGAARWTTRPTAAARAW